MAITTKRKAQLYTEGANIDANYGPWDSIADYESFITEDAGLNAPYDATTIAVKNQQTGVISKYIYENSQWRLDIPETTYTHPASHPASMITYNASTEYESGNVGYEIKQLVTSLAAKYVKPGTGIPKADLANDVQTSLGYADDYNTNKSSFVTSTALETALTGLSPYSAGTGILITTVSNGKQIAVDTAVYKVKDVQNASGISLVTSGIATIPITQINKSDNTQLSPASGVVTLPEIPDDATDISFDDSVAHLGTTLTPVDTVQKAINVIAVGVAGNIGKLIIKLLYPNSTPITDKEISITARYRGNSFDLSPQYTPDFSGFKTDSNGYVVNADGGEFISLPLGATYTIHYTDISDSYLTPEDTTGVIDSSEKTINNIYQNVSENEFVYFYVQMPNVLASAVTPVDKVINVDIYSTPTTHALAYKCILRGDGTIKQILNADGTQATYNGNPLISNNNPVLLPISTGTKYLSSLQLWDPSLSENEQRYVKSSDIIYTASKAKRTVKFEYLDNQVGIFLIIADATTAKGYRACLVTGIDTTNSKIFFKDGDYTYEAYLSNSILYKKLENDIASEVWEETILGYGIKTSTTILNANDDSATSSEYPNCSFIMPKNATTLKGALSSANVSINIPVNFGGLFVSACYNELSGDTNSPLINRLLNNGEEAWVLTTTGGTKTIKGFAATLYQVNIIKGVINQVSTINNILFGTNYTYAKTGVSSIHPITLVTNNGANIVSNGSTIVNLIASTLGPGNPRQAIIANTDLNIIVLYPFS